MAAVNVRLHIGRLVLESEAAPLRAPTSSELAAAVRDALLFRLSKPGSREVGNRKEIANAIADGLLRHRTVAVWLSGRLGD
jgi:hypothetical protein